MLQLLYENYKFTQEKHVFDAIFDCFAVCEFGFVDLTINGLVASDSVIIPLQCEFFALEGLSSLMQTIDSIKGSYNEHLEVQGVVLTMYDKRNLLSSLVEKDVREHLGNKVYSTIIPRNVRISEAPSHGKPVLIYDVGCTGSKAYIELAKEVIKQQNGEQI